MQVTGISQPGNQGPGLFWVPGPVSSPGIGRPDGTEYQRPGRIDGIADRDGRIGETVEFVFSALVPGNQIGYGGNKAENKKGFADKRESNVQYQPEGLQRGYGRRYFPGAMGEEATASKVSATIVVPKIIKGRLFLPALSPCW